MDFCAFDFAGCGNSTGDWVTHGFREIGDLHIILNFLLIKFYISVSEDIKIIFINAPISWNFKLSPTSDGQY